MTRFCPIERLDVECPSDRSIIHERTLILGKGFGIWWIRFVHSLNWQENDVRQRTLLKFCPFVVYLLGVFRLIMKCAMLIVLGQNAFNFSSDFSPVYA